MSPITTSRKAKPNVAVQKMKFLRDQFYEILTKRKKAAIEQKLQSEKLEREYQERLKELNQINGINIV